MSPSSATRPAAAPTTSRPARRPAASSASTAGTWARSPSGPDAHFHASISESFFVLSGTVRLYDGKALGRRARQVTSSTCPPGGIHAFRNESGELASMLILFTPGRAAGGLLRDAGRRRVRGMTDDEQAEFFLRHDTLLSWTGS